MEYRLTIPFVLPGLNDYIREERGHWSKAANLKSSAQKKIVLLCRKDLHGVRIEKPVFIRYLWIEKNRRRDRDNIAFAKKFIQDALVEAKVISGDGWNNIVGFSDNFAVDRHKARIEVTISEVNI